MKMTGDKRRYYRLQPSEEAEPQASMEIDGRAIDLTVVNISPGGILCYVSAEEPGIERDVFVRKLTIKLPESKPVIYSGKIARTEVAHDSLARFCAIEFVQFGNKVLAKGSKPLSAAPAALGDTDRYFLHRLESVKFPEAARNVHAEIKIREMLYDEFHESARRLPMEERWYFYEILDSMKVRQPDYPEGLKMEFLRLCRGEDRSEFVSSKTGKGLGNKLKGLFRRRKGTGFGTE